MPSGDVSRIKLYHQHMKNTIPLPDFKESFRTFATTVIMGILALRVPSCAQ